jgi:hypothetical protein
VTERPEPEDAPEIAEVRRLLAEARHPEPMPDDVARRLDDVLSGLATETPVTEPSPPEPGDVHQGEVVPIAAHRRRKVAGLLVAAAAVVVGGVTLAPHLSTGSGSSQTAGSEDSAGGTQDNNFGNTGQQQSTPQKAPSPQNDQTRTTKGLVVVRPRHFSDDARQGRRLLDRVYAAQSAKPPCPDVPGPGRRVAAEYRHAPAVLVYRRAQGNSQVVDLYVCGNDRPVRSTTLPVP